ncbi:serine/threonine-protein kinase [Agromyces kandeliae]|uniref:non-specific serine/threonine protein kinase n=1 Tax=Agromyces kandeliae TaxID=2666141 RepID=A0A6L5R1G6_9MICO|nr:serine/threonine-protein kinase [Agromyces kandeliae]MRX43802.1 protein kinase [Agromyces kandeliae]
MRPSAGLTFGGRYELQSRIAIGGMGEVWQATDLVIGRQVALKILKDEYLGDPGFLERFRAEARHAALVNHEGIANVFDYGEEEGSAYLVMELVPGEALSTILEREHVLSTDKVLDIVAQTAAALQAAHAAGLVHRDIKPGNLLITPDGRVKITDFGIARIADQVPLTATGQVMGTVQYLSPEQASGHPASPTTDIYSLGIVAYECLAGRRPFTGESQVAIAMAQINETPPDLPVTVSEPVRNLVYSCIAKNPADRPQTAAHLARAATALRRGDVQAAAAAVPAILGAAAGMTAATMLMPQAGANTAATTVLAAGAGVPDGEEEPPAERKRSPWTWPLIVLIILLALVLIGTLIALALNSGNRPAASTSSGPPSSSSAPPTSSSAPPPETTTAAPTTVQIDRSAYIGRSVDDVRAELEGLGFPVNTQEGAPATTPDQANTVSDVNPSGPVEIGTTITVTYLGTPETPTAPANAPTVNPADVASGGIVQVSWPAASCPSGQQLSGYEVAVTNDATAPSPVGAGTTNVNVQAGSQDFEVTYRYFCGQLDSPFSPAAPVTIQP